MHCRSRWIILPKQIDGTPTTRRSRRRGGSNKRTYTHHCCYSNCNSEGFVLLRSPINSKQSYKEVMASAPSLQTATTIKISWTVCMRCMHTLKAQTIQTIRDLAHSMSLNPCSLCPSLAGKSFQGRRRKKRCLFPPQRPAATYCIVLLFYARVDRYRPVRTRMIHMQLPMVHRGRTVQYSGSRKSGGRKAK